MPLITPISARNLLPGIFKNLFFPPEKNEYTYFSDARDFPFTKANNIARAAWAADASMLCYARYGLDRMSYPPNGSPRNGNTQLEECLSAGNLTLVETIGEAGTDWNASGTQAYFATGDGFAILAFRGTEADDKQDLVDDLDLALVHEPHLGYLSTVLHLFSDPCFVHRGFQRALDRVWSQVQDLLVNYRRENPQAEICITGHSLGGALAVLTYSRFRDDWVSAYTFGCPRVGDSTFANRVAAKGKGHFRCVNFNDLVAHVPLESPLYCHAPQTCSRFDEAGALDQEYDGRLLADLATLGSVFNGLPADLTGNWAKYLDLPVPPGLVDHSPARYCMQLWNCVR